MALYSEALGIHSVTSTPVSGIASFNINPPDTGTVYVTVSKYARVPYEGEFAVRGGVIKMADASLDVVEGIGTLVIPVLRSGDTNILVTVDYQTVDGTAVSSQDYTSNSGSLSFSPGVVSNSISILITGDTDDESGESFSVQLLNVSANGVILAPTNTVVGIEDDDGPGEVNFSSATYTEGESGGSTTITVLREQGSSGFITVDYQTSDGSATAGSDYATSSGTLSFADSVVSQSFTVTLIPDVQEEGDETVNLALSNVTGGGSLGATSNAVLTITDDDEAGSVEFEAGDYLVSETNGTVTLSVVRSGGSDGLITVDYSTSNGTALQGSDYETTSGTVTMQHAVTSATIQVVILNDLDVEDAETFTLSLSNPTGAADLGALDSAEVLISSDDGLIAGVYMNTDPGWTTEGFWEWGQPTGGYGDLSFGPDPTSGFTGNNVYGYNLDGGYEDNMTVKYLTSTAFDCSEYKDVTLKFKRWLGVEESTYDHASLQISTNGATWSTVWANSGNLDDEHGRPVEHCPKSHSPHF